MVLQPTVSRVTKDLRRVSDCMNSPAKTVVSQFEFVRVFMPKPDVEPQLGCEDSFAIRMSER